MSIDLNFRKTKGVPYRPTRCWRKNTGPFDVRRIATAIAQEERSTKDQPDHAAYHIDYSLDD